MMLPGPPYLLKHRRARTLWGLPLSAGLLTAFVFYDDPAFNLPPSGSWYGLIWIGTIGLAFVDSAVAIFRPAIEIDRSEIRIRHEAMLTKRIPAADVTDLRIRRENNSYSLRVLTEDVGTDVKVRLPRDADWMGVERQLRTFFGLHKAEP